MDEVIKGKKKTLSELLDTVGDENDDVMSIDPHSNDQVQDNDDSNTTTVDPNFCIDCRDMPTEIVCVTCNEPFCKVCFTLVHKSGSRKKHISQEVKSHLKEDEETLEEEDDENKENKKENGKSNKNLEDASEDVTDVQQEAFSSESRIMQGIKKSAKFIPIRLTAEERQLLRLLEAALNVSEYTDRVDILSYKSKSRRIIEQLKEICSILAGLVVASNLKVGQKLIEDKNFEDNAEWYQSVFEIGRRYKIMNPEKMRNSFGKLCYMVMDSRLPEVKEHMEFDLYKPIKTVYTYLDSKQDKKALEILDDELIMDATAEIRPEGKPRNVINRMIKMKESAIERLSMRYSSANGFTKEEIRQVLYSIGDFNAYTNSNRMPIVRMIGRLENFFNDSDISSNSKYNLGIRFGLGGARLSHTHEDQYKYVIQSLQLWSHIMRDMIALWSAADEDLFNGHRYSLTSTGQGLNRVKACPAVYNKMHRILSECQRQCNGWVGSSAIHLGDHTVPNALFFLDKYTQVPSILTPVDQALNEIEHMATKDRFAREYMENQFESVEDLTKTILCDFFRHAFDGSGSNNFYDAGSCIDGRLTSAWNWANKISSKDYYKFFLMSGFIGFNGNEGF